MKLAFHVLNAFAGPAQSFASRTIKGNPAAVCPLDAWLPDELLQAVAAENNLSETAFFVRRGDVFELRWFTPTVEMDLCGHATLAAASVILERPNVWPDVGDAVRFLNPISGELGVRRNGPLFELDFPAWKAVPVKPPPDLISALGCAPIDILATQRDYMCVFGSEEDVRDMRPDFDLLRRLDKGGVVVAARGRESDVVCRYFAPAEGIPEDPVTGSAHCELVPYWARVLRKAKLTSRQLSARGGELFCEDRGERVAIAGRVAPYVEGLITL